MNENPTNGWQLFAELEEAVDRGDAGAVSALLQAGADPDAVEDLAFGWADHRPEGMESDPEVERIAVEVVMKYERDQGRKPVSVEEENCGWDVTSLLDGQVERYIEVKGRASLGGVALTPNEWIKAQRFGKDYWLYVVVNCKANEQLYLIQDPASKLNPKEEVSVVRYMVGLNDWRSASTRSDA